jgi:transcriptional regulator with XRE-family HTH domain
MTDNPLPQRFGEKLHALRTKYKMSLQKLASLLGYSAHGYISELEAGKKVPTMEFVLKVAQIFNVTTDQLLRDELEVIVQDQPAALPFVSRFPTASEVEKLRLLLSTFQDGSGMIRRKGEAGTLPGWRDFERVCAATFNGEGVENKFFVDVIFRLSENPRTFYGIDCKMRGELRRAERYGKIYVEVTNAEKLLWSQLYLKGITESNYRDKPDLAGNSLIEAVEYIKTTGSANYPGGRILLDKSYYFVLQWSPQGNYQLYQLPLKLENPGNLIWACHVSARSDGTETTRLVGENTDGILYEWYGDSGGQFKYYPSVDAALWKSEVFRLEALPDTLDAGLVAKAKAYFPEQWMHISNN